MSNINLSSDSLRSDSITSNTIAAGGGSVTEEVKHIGSNRRSNMN